MEAYNIPDRSKGDFYCKVCDSHMATQEIWMNHVIGKRHIKNVEKGTSDSKYENLDVESGLKNELKYAKGPIVGLSYLHEFRRSDPRASDYYNCYLCHATLPLPEKLIIEHVTSLKHKLNYLKETDIKKYTSIMDTHLGKDHIIPLVEEACDELEFKLGRGSIVVKREKDKRIIPSSFKDVVERHNRKPEYIILPRKRDRSESFSSLSSYEHRKKPRSEYRRRLSRHERNRRTPSRSRSRSRFSPYESKRESSTRWSTYEHKTKIKRHSGSRSRISPYESQSHSKSARRLSPNDHKKKSKCKSCMKKRLSNKEEKETSKSSANASHLKKKPDERKTIVYQKTTSDVMVFTADFYEKLKKFPPNVFVKLAIEKLDTFDMNGVDCSLRRDLLKLKKKAEDLLRSKVPDLFDWNSNCRSPREGSPDIDDLLENEPSIYGPFPLQNSSYESDVSSMLSLVESNNEQST